MPATSRSDRRARKSGDSGEANESATTRSEAGPGTTLRTSASKAADIVAIDDSPIANVRIAARHTAGFLKRVRTMGFPVCRKSALPVLVLGELLHGVDD